MELRDSEDFENRIFAKQFTLDTFRRDLARVKHGEGIGIGTATDPYQPAERRYGLTGDQVSKPGPSARPASAPAPAII